MQALYLNYPINTRGGRALTVYQELEDVSFLGRNQAAITAPVKKAMLIFFIEQGENGQESRCQRYCCVGLIGG